MSELCFELAPVVDGAVARLARALDLHPVAAEVLCRRGYADPQLAAAFLEEEERHPPTAFAGIEEVTTLIEDHLRRGSLIAVHGDYDVDGLCGTAILLSVLRAKGGRVRHYLPRRDREGYGLSLETVERLAAQGVSLLITVDCGIRATAEVARARALGIDVVVSDHHEPPAVPPQAPILHPELCAYPFTSLCGAAVAFKLAQQLAAGNAALQERVEREIELVALATVADSVPLVGENRALVRQGLRALACTNREGLKALLGLAKVEGATVDERDLAFSLAPRLNAPGRVSRADGPLELLLCEQPARAQEVAHELDRANRLRKRLERHVLFQAEAQVKGLGPRPAYVLAGEGWHPGVVGIVAARLVEQYNRPFALVALDGGRGRGSARSVEGFDLVGALAACAEHLARFGGHRMAAGFEVERASLQGFGAAFQRVAWELLGGGARPRRVRVDAKVDGSQLGGELAEQLALLAPFGMGNPPVALLLEGARVVQATPIGEGRHLRFVVEHGGARINAVAFRASRLEARRQLKGGQPIDGAFVLELNEWRGDVEPRLRLLAVRPSPVGELARLAYPVMDGRRTSTAAA